MAPLWLDIQKWYVHEIIIFPFTNIFVKCHLYILQKINLGGGLPAVKDLNPSCPNFVVFLDRAGPNSSRYRLLTHTVHVQSLRVFVTNSSEITNSLPTPLILHFVFLL